MANIGIAAPDTAAKPAAQDPVAPHNGHVPTHLQVAPIDDSVSSRRSAGTEVTSNNLLGGKVRSDSDDAEHGGADQKAAAQGTNGEAKTADPKAGIISTMIDKPLKGPRNGVHWGAGALLLLCLCNDSSHTMYHCSGMLPGGSDHLTMTMCTLQLCQFRCCRLLQTQGLPQHFVHP